MTAATYQAPASLTLANAAAARDAGLTALQGGLTDVDLSSVGAVDSSSVVVLLAWHRAAQAAGKRLRCHHVPADLVSLATLYGLAELVTPAS